METTHPRSYCVQSLIDAGLPVEAPKIGITYTSDEIGRMARGYKLGRMGGTGRAAAMRNQQAQFTCTICRDKLLRSCMKRDFTRVELARLSQLHPKTIQRILATPTVSVKYVTLFAIAEALGVPPESLLADAADDQIAAD